MDSRGDSGPDNAWLRTISETLLWLGFARRRPGLLTRPRKLIGHVRDGRQAELELSDETWAFSIDGADREAFADTASALEVIARDGFVPDKAVVVADIAELLFRGAVEQAESSVTEYEEAVAIGVRVAMQTGAKGVLPQELIDWAMSYPVDDPIDTVIASSLLDRSLRRSIGAITLAIAAGEAQVNSWASDGSGWAYGEDKESLVRKLKLAASKRGTTIDIGRDPFQALDQLVDFRNDLVHPKPVEQELTLADAEAPARDMSVRARRCCLLVREALIEVATSIREPCPRYLAYCPPGSPDDAQAWRHASLQTGVRDDPDFPPLSTGG